MWRLQNICMKHIVEIFSDNLVLTHIERHFRKLIFNKFRKQVKWIFIPIFGKSIIRNWVTTHFEKYVSTYAWIVFSKSILQKLTFNTFWKTDMSIYACVIFWTSIFRRFVWINLKNIFLVFVHEPKAQLDSLSLKVSIWKCLNLNVSVWTSRLESLSSTAWNRKSQLERFNLNVSTRKSRLDSFYLKVSASRSRLESLSISLGPASFSLNVSTRTSQLESFNLQVSARQFQRESLNSKVSAWKFQLESLSLNVSAWKSQLESFSLTLYVSFLVFGYLFRTCPCWFLILGCWSWSWLFVFFDFDYGILSF